MNTRRIASALISASCTVHMHMLHWRLSAVYRNPSATKWQGTVFYFILKFVSYTFLIKKIIKERKTWWGTKIDNNLSCEWSQESACSSEKKWRYAWLKGTSVIPPEKIIRLLLVLPFWTCRRYWLLPALTTVYFMSFGVFVTCFVLWLVFRPHYVMSSYRNRTDIDTLSKWGWGSVNQETLWGNTPSPSH